MSSSPSLPFDVTVSTESKNNIPSKDSLKRRFSLLKKGKMNALTKRNTNDNLSLNNTKSNVTFASSETLYHLPNLWKENVLQTVDSEDDVPVADTLSDTASTFSTEDSLCSLEKSLFAALNTDIHDMEPRPRPIVIGHRGSLYTDPENTLASFRVAFEMGADAVELDVFLSEDNVLIVFHGDGGDKNPGSLDTYCGIPGKITDCTVSQIKKFEFYAAAGVFPCPHSKLATASIPTLEEVLVMAKDVGLFVKIELKGVGTEIPAVELVERLGMIDQCSFSSFYHDRIARIRKVRRALRPDGQHVVRTGALFNSFVPCNFIHMAKEAGATEVHLRYSTCTRDRVAAIHAAGMESMAWFPGPRTMKKESEDDFWDVGNEDEDMYRAVLNTGVRGMCVNRPNILIWCISPH